MKINILNYVVEVNIYPKRITNQVDEYCLKQFGGISKINRIKALRELYPGKYGLKEAKYWVEENYENPNF